MLLALLLGYYYIIELMLNQSLFQNHAANSFTFTSNESLFGEIFYIFWVWTKYLALTGAKFFEFLLWFEWFLCLVHYLKKE